MQRPETGIKDYVEEVDPVHKFLFGPFRPKKKNRTIFSDVPLLCWNDPKSRVSFTFQPYFSETLCKGQTTLVHKGQFYKLSPLTSNFNLHGLASKFSFGGSSV